MWEQVYRIGWCSDAFENILEHLLFSWIWLEPCVVLLCSLLTIIHLSFCWRIERMYHIQGVSKKNAPPSLLHNSGTKYRIFKCFFSPENWDPYANFEYKTISVRYSGAEIFTKQNVVLKQIIPYSCCLIMAWKPQNLRQALPTTQTNWIYVKTVFI